MIMSFVAAIRKAQELDGDTRPIYEYLHEKSLAAAQRNIPIHLCESVEVECDYIDDFYRDGECIGPLQVGHCTVVCGCGCLMSTQDPVDAEMAKFTCHMCGGFITI